MKVMLTSFGAESALEDPQANTYPFFQMPPVAFRSVRGRFVPDFDLLLLCDKVVMDKASFEQLQHTPRPSYDLVSEAFKELSSQGRIELVDFQSILASNRSLLARMTDEDLSSLEPWVAPLRESMGTWARFAELFAIPILDDSRVLGTIHGDFSDHNSLHFGDIRLGATHSAIKAGAQQSHNANLLTAALKSSAKRKKKDHRDALSGFLRSYLTHVNANLILANVLQVGFHDWLDFAPFYAKKFLAVGRDKDPVYSRREQLEKLFTISFPDLAIRDTASLLKVLNDKRVQDLRRLITEAVDGKVQFDNQFATSVLSEVLKAEHTAKKWRNVVGWVALPAHLIPVVGVPAPKLIEEAVGTVLEKLLAKQHRWFYMLSEVAKARSGASLA